MLTSGTEKWKNINWQENGEKILCFVQQCQAIWLQLQENVVLSIVTTKCLHCSQDTICIQFSSFHSELKYHIFISSYRGNETSFGRWWNWKAAEVQYMWRGTVRSWVLWGVPYKGAGGEADNKKRCVHWILLYSKITIYDSVWASTSSI